jgi:HK97 family phage major capsid protein
MVKYFSFYNLTSENDFKEEYKLNEVILGLQKKLGEMKALVPTEAASPEQIKNYFNDTEEIIEGILKAACDQESALTTELEGVKQTVKELRGLLKKTDAVVEPMSMRDLQFYMGKAMVAAWNRDERTLGELKFCPNVRNENWNNPKDFQWNAEKGFVPVKAALGEPIGNITTNDQYLINPVYEDTIMQEAAKKSVMMNLVTNRPMRSASIFIPERERGGVELKWLTSYGQKIEATKPNVPTRTELKAYTLAGFIPWFDEFEEDVYVDLGKMFIEDMTEAYGQEFDRQCLIANNAPFTGALNAAKIKNHAISSPDVSKLSWTDFRDAELKIAKEERGECKWFMNETVLNHVVNIKDDNGNPIWRKPGDNMPSKIDGYEVVESSILPQFADIEADSPIALFMNPKKILHGNRKGIEIKRFDETTESLEYGELFLRFRKRDGFLVTRANANVVALKTGKTS